MRGLQTLQSSSLPRYKQNEPLVAIEMRSPMRVIAIVIAAIVANSIAIPMLVLHPHRTTSNPFAYAAALLLGEVCFGLMYHRWTRTDAHSTSEKVQRQVTQSSEQRIP
jgi:hypothetical protein